MTHRPPPSPDRDGRSDVDRRLSLSARDDSWRVLTDGATRADVGVPPPRRVLLQIVVSALVVLVVVVVAGLSATRRAAEDQGLRDATERTDLLAVNA
ncbi:MAG: hypothetical protein ACRCY9_19215, partial [Phycicoccus sp.]